jgi:hypothetical protein
LILVAWQRGDNIITGNLKEPQEGHNKSLEKRSENINLGKT